MPIIVWPTNLSWPLINPTRALGERFLDYLIGEPIGAVLLRGAGVKTGHAPSTNSLSPAGRLGRNRKEFEGSASCTINR